MNLRDVPFFVEKGVAGNAIFFPRLCRLRDQFNCTIGVSLSMVLRRGLSQKCEQTEGHEAAEGLLPLQHTGGGPT